MDDNEGEKLLRSIASLTAETLQTLRQALMEMAAAAVQKEVAAEAIASAARGYSKDAFASASDAAQRESDAEAGAALFRGYAKACEHIGDAVTAILAGGVVDVAEIVGEAIDEKKEERDG